MTAEQASPSLSVVIPTHNRRELLHRVLDALAHQTADPATFEVIVVPDGCADGTEGMLGAQNYPFALKIVEQSDSGGPAAARNAGSKAAVGRILLFLDDDVEPSPGWLEAHRRSHELQVGPVVVLGPYPPVPHASPELFRAIARNWWTKHFDELKDPGHRFSFRDLLTGNLSLPAEVWEQVSGLDPSFRAHEDYELGVRLMLRGIPFRFASDALAYHHEYETTTLAGAFRRAREEGRSDVLLSKKHPHVQTGLRVTTLFPRSCGIRGVLHHLLFVFGEWIDPLAQGVAAMLPIIARRRLRGLYFALYHELNEYWYLRGVAETLKTRLAWKRFANGAPPPHPAKKLSVDLRAGIRAAEVAMDRARPDEVVLRYDGKEFGVLPCEVGVEPWKGSHLKPALCGRLAQDYLERLLEAGDMEGVPPICRDAVQRGITKARLAMKVPREQMWWEQDGQWRVFISGAGD
ncbi:glycosyltransferase family 2 protein [Bradyrhizobium glycinis]|uniref:glycosyltransferase family 2 protein n=1 Tax=Bradyrhizobium glycinis TaxID=2751812 RepID=UPI0018D7FD8F|nr:glycosyltransferase family 2 protein [Bradyrhizobium glycinis]MBH5368979.1 glycosyltransferase family 2 protein [Bradyrhizobium glycinis]